MPANQAVHDGQTDAMPCQCPACSSPFIAPRRREPASSPDLATLIDDIAEAKVCPAWCGDACTCGRGPESADLDPLDVAGMRAVEGRS